MACLDAGYDRVKTLKESERGSVSLLRHRQSGKLFIFRNYQGNGEVYQKLLGIRCENLPQIMEAAEKDGMDALVDVTAAAFRLVDHTDFHRNAAELLREMGCVSPRQLMELISL